LGKTWSALESTIGGYWGEKINKNMLTKIAILSRVNDRKRAKGRGAWQEFLNVVKWSKAA
jgi:hypothetical protein